jgi:hypothetical protein
MSRRDFTISPTWLLIAAVVVLRCAQEPDDQLILNGTLTTLSGAPLSDAGVTLLRTDLLGCPQTLHPGLNGQNLPYAFNSFAATQTDPNGGYLFDIWRFQAWTESAPGTNRCFRVEVDGDTGSKSLLQLGGGAFNSTAPALELWPDAPLLSSDPDGGYMLQNPPLRGAPIIASVDGGAGDFNGTSAVYDWALVQGDSLVWHSLNEGGDFSVDGPLLEDFSVCASAEALLIPQVVTNGLPFDAAQFLAMARSSTACLPPGTSVPLSRGKSCQFTPGGGVAQPLSPCPLTDGVLDLYALRPDRAFPDVLGAQDTIDLDLGHSVAVRTIIIRGLVWTGSIVESQGPGGRGGPKTPPSVAMTVSGSVDSQTYTSLAAAQPAPSPITFTPGSLPPVPDLFAILSGGLGDYRIDLPAEPQVRYLRLEAGPNQAFWAVREISAFAP